MWKAGYEISHLKLQQYLRNLSKISPNQKKLKFNIASEIPLLTYSLNTLWPVIEPNWKVGHTSTGTRLKLKRTAKIALPEKEMFEKYHDTLLSMWQKPIPVPYRPHYIGSKELKGFIQPFEGSYKGRYISTNRGVEKITLSIETLKNNKNMLRVKQKMGGYDSQGTGLAQSSIIRTGDSKNPVVFLSGTPFSLIKGYKNEYIMIQYKRYENFESTFLYPQNIAFLKKE